MFDVEAVKKLETSRQRRNYILELQEALGSVDGARFNEDEDMCPLTHRFIEGVYVREMYARKGTFAVGKLHKKEHIAIFSMGKVTILSEERGLFTVKAPATMIVSAGTKNAGFFHENTIWTTIHRTDETDLEKIREELIASSYAELGEK